jgi:hypothetical protein
VRGRGPRLSGGTAEGGAPYVSAWGPILRGLGTAPDSAASVYLGSPKPHDVRSVSPDPLAVALRRRAHHCGQGGHRMIPSGAHEHLTAPQVADVTAGRHLGELRLSAQARLRERRRSHEEATSRLPARGVRVPGICAHLRVAPAEVSPGGSITLSRRAGAAAVVAFFSAMALHPARRVAGFDRRPEPRA